MDAEVLIGKFSSEFGVARSFSTLGPAQFVDGAPDAGRKRGGIRRASTPNSKPKSQESGIRSQESEMAANPLRGSFADRLILISAC